MRPKKSCKGCRVGAGCDNFLELTIDGGLEFTKAWEHLSDLNSLHFYTHINIFSQKYRRIHLKYKSG